MSYGPDAFIKQGETFLFNGVEMPVIADATFAELWEKASGNYTNYARFYLGSTLSFAKSQAFEYQCTHKVGKEGAGKISNAIALGTIKHPELALTSNPWYTSVPTTLPHTEQENNKIAEFTELSASGKFSQSKGKFNLFVTIICTGYANTGEGLSTRADVINTVKTAYGGTQYLLYKNNAWARLQDYYNTLR
jgi:putative aldouronate transport system substrate-binding protein